MPLGTAGNFAGTAGTPDAAAGSFEVAAHSLGAAAGTKSPVLVRIRPRPRLTVLPLAASPFAPAIPIPGLFFLGALS